MDPMVTTFIEWEYVSMDKIEKVSYNNHLHMVGVGINGQDREGVFK
jgi:hypothetical protein